MGYHFETETGAIHKSWRKDQIRIALIYPNVYHVGMANLGWQVVYSIFNSYDGIVCERFFLPENKNKVVSIESNRLLNEFDIVAFSISFEHDYLNVISILKEAGLPLRSIQRNNNHPLVIAGGVATFLNPSPLSPFIDCFLIGEAEVILPDFVNLLYSSEYQFENKRNKLELIAQTISSAYIPVIYGNSNISSYSKRIKCEHLMDLDSMPTVSIVHTNDQSFQESYLIEVSRGCPHGCRFCSAGFVYRPPRFRSRNILEMCIDDAHKHTIKKVGLMGAAVSDLPFLNELCNVAFEKKIQVSFSSLRADALSNDLINAMKLANIRTATIAPDSGSIRIRRVINKHIDESNIFNAVNLLIKGGIPNIKFYFMVGLPFEEFSDIEESVALCKSIYKHFLSSSKSVGKIGTMTISVNCFVPKPFTPFQWVSMESVSSLRMKLDLFKKALQSMSNIKLQLDDVKKAYIQAMLSRGDHYVGNLLEQTLNNGNNWTKTLKETDIQTDEYVTRERTPDESLAWDMIDHGVRKAYLLQELDQATQGKESSQCPMNACNICGAC